MLNTRLNIYFAVGIVSKYHLNQRSLNLVGVKHMLKFLRCKVEFIQPSKWLYSVPNLLVIQHLVTLYLGGFDVRVVSEIE